MPERHSALLFIICEEKRAIEIDRNLWEAPFITYEKLYLEELSDERRIIEEKKLSGFKAKKDIYKEIAHQFFKKIRNDDYDRKASKNLIPRYIPSEGKKVLSNEQNINKTNESDNSNLFDKFINISSISFAIFMFIVFVQQNVWLGLYVLPALFFFGAISGLLGDVNFKSKALTSVKSFSNNIVMVIVGLIFLFVAIGLLGVFDSCETKYRKAWEACNDKYNGKCSYLGPKFKPSCDLEQYIED